MKLYDLASDIFPQRVGKEYVAERAYAQMVAAINDDFRVGHRSTVLGATVVFTIDALVYNHPLCGAKKRLVEREIAIFLNLHQMQCPSCFLIVGDVVNIVFVAV